MKEGEGNYLIDAWVWVQEALNDQSVFQRVEMTAGVPPFTTKNQWHKGERR